MDYLWTPWRYHYVRQAGPEQACIFCEALKRDQDQGAFIVFRGQHNFVLLNRYPYTSGHSMVAPYAHVATLEAAAPEALVEMIQLCRRLTVALAAEYQPQGYNLGMNLGHVAGAGVADHIHMHVLPRWAGDTSFMTTVGEARIEPEELGVTYGKLRAHFRK